MNELARSKLRNPTVYVVDDDEIVGRALSIVLRTVGYTPAIFSRPEDFLSNFDPSQHACVVLDIRMPHMSGLQVQKSLNRTGAILPVIFITGHGDIPMAVRAMKDGAFDFLTKPFRDHELLDRVNSALNYDAENRAMAYEHTDLRDREQTLTAREREVLRLVAGGNANRVVAVELGLSERTVEIHRANVMQKMGARSVAHLVMIHLNLRRENMQ